VSERLPKARAAPLGGQHLWPAIGLVASRLSGLLPADPQPRCYDPGIKIPDAPDDTPAVYEIVRHASVELIAIYKMDPLLHTALAWAVACEAFRRAAEIGGENMMDWWDLRATRYWQRLREALEGLQGGGRCRAASSQDSARDPRPLRPGAGRAMSDPR
jgi:hypothetical protein